MIYYCEIENELEPYFPNYMVERNTPEEAIAFFTECHGEKLECVYDEVEFHFVYEKD